MRDQQIALEQANMKQTNMKDFMDSLDAKRSSDVLFELSAMVEKEVSIHHDNTQRKRSPFFKYTKDMDYGDVAYIGLKNLIGTMTTTSSMAAVTIGANIGNDLLVALGREEDSFSIEETIQKDKVSAGLALLRITLAGMPENYFRTILERLSKTMQQWTVSTNVGFEKLLEENSKMFSYFSKKMSPMVCQPDDWNGVTGGGYLTDTAKKLTPLIKRNPNHVAPEGDTVINAINHLQKTPYRINKAVFEVCQVLQETRPEAMKKVFMSVKGKFEEQCPIDQEADKYLWEKEEGVKVDAKGKEKKAMVMVHQDEESLKKRKDFFRWAARRDLHKKRKLAKKSLDRSYDTCMALVDELSVYDEIYWAYSLDRRSRVYPSAMTGINLQGSDYQKANIEFAVGLPLDYDNDGEGGEYAIIKTMCNHWGNDSGNGVKTDKLTRKEAQNWLYGLSGYSGSEDWILKCANAPLEETVWMKADKPLQFLAAILEWKAWKEYRVLHNDYKFVSHLCDPNDASCSGAQILSAMTRDMIGAMHTNLLDMPVQDLYMAVAKKVSDNLFNMVGECELSQDWLGRSNVIKEIQDVIQGVSVEVFTDESKDDVINYTNDGLSPEDIYAKMYTKLTQVECDRFSLIIRNLVKKPVMVKFYSGTRYGNIEHCNEFVVEKHWEEYFRCDGTGKAAAFMGNLIYDSINQVIAGAGQVMEWFVHVAEVLGGENLPVNWTTPIGFKASMKKHSMKNVRLHVLFQGESGYNEFTLKIPKLINTEEGEPKEYKLDVAKMKSGIAPDIVHSLDASLIMKVAERCAKEGIQYLTMIHDSLGSHCCYSGKFNRIIREEFIEIFKEDILHKMYLEFLSQLPEDAKCLLASPEKFGIKYGKYKLETLLDSEFCFK
jgi:DNA-directed RNA polymerase